jgi:hypothetical protein
LAKASASSELSKAEHHQVAVIAAQGAVSGFADPTPAAQNITLTVDEAPRLFGRKRHVIRPFALEITAGDFAFAASHRLIAISFVAGTLNSLAPFSTAAASSGA